MSHPSTTDERAGQKSLAAMLIVAGAAIIAASFLWPAKAGQRGAWSTEQAKQYQAAAGKLHALSHEIVHAKPDREQTVREELKSAKANYDALRGQLDSAIARPRRWAWIIRAIGIAAVLLGGIRLFTLPNDDGG